MVDSLHFKGRGIIFVSETMRHTSLRSFGSVLTKEIFYRGDLLGLFVRQGEL